MILFFIFYTLQSQDTLSVMYYNVLNYPGSTPGRVSNFRTISQSILPDVMLITELLSEEGADILLNDGLNVGTSSTYARAAFTDGPDTDNMLFYKSDKLTLYAQNSISTDLRLINEYVLYNNFEGGGLGSDTIFIHFFIAHLKSSTGSSNEQQRLLEAITFKQYLDENGIEKNIIFGGDFNFYDDGEPAYQYLTGSSQVGLIDPLPAGVWHDNASFAGIHTQSTRSTQFGGGASGGMDDRFDFILFSEDIQWGSNAVAYIPESCYAYGNDGNHFNVGILDPPANVNYPDSVIQALHYMTDHLPVLCKIKIDEPILNPTAWLNIKVYLEGPFNGINMNTGLEESIPVLQPYADIPWLYNGNESIETTPASGIVDWCLLELRVSEGSAIQALSENAVWQQACLIMTDGSIRATNKVSLPSFEDTIPGKKYLIVHHRNHLDIMSSTNLVLTDTIYSFNFTTSESSVFGGLTGYSQLSQDLWGMTSGDTDGNGIINNLDIQNVWTLQSGKSGYFLGDLNFNLEVDNTDKNEHIIPHLYKFSPINQ